MSGAWRQLTGRAALFALVSAAVYGAVFQAFWTAEMAVAMYIALPVYGLLQGVFGFQIFAPVLRHSWWRVLIVVLVLDVLIAFGLGAAGIESAVCLIVGFPVVLVMQACGIWLAIWRNGRSGRLNFSLLALLLVAPLVDANLAYPTRSQVIRTEIDIAASPGRVWSNTLTIPIIGADELPWTFSHNLMGVPAPLSATYTKGVRHLRWAEGVRLREIVTEMNPLRKIAWRFDFHDMAALRTVDPHISPNSQFTRFRQGEYLLEPLADGGTLLVLQTTLDIATPLNIYFGAWAERILQDFHKSVLHVIKTRAEAAK